MTKKRTLDPEMIDSVAQNMFYALPLIKKRLLHMDMVQKEHGTPLSHVQVLAMLQDVGTMSVSEISRRLGIAKPNITPLVDRLFEAGYVDRQHDENDRRVVNIVLLPAGMEKLSAIRATISRQIQTQAEDLSLSEFRELHDSLESVVRILSSLYCIVRPPDGGLFLLLQSSFLGEEAFAYKSRQHEDEVSRLERHLKSSPSVTDSFGEKRRRRDGGSSSL